MHYFSYGSNMSTKRLRGRAPSATKVGVGALEYHELIFHKVGKNDGTAKCDAKETGKPEHIVHGVVFRIAESEKAELDKHEGLGYGYEQKDVVVRLNDGTTVQAFTYFATRVDPNLKPLDWYKEHVLIGAKENGLPDGYIKKIEAVESNRDNDTARHERELSVYT